MTISRRRRRRALLYRTLSRVTSFPVDEICFDPFRSRNPPCVCQTSLRVALFEGALMPISYGKEPAPHGKRGKEKLPSGAAS